MKSARVRLAAAVLCGLIALTVFAVCSVQRQCSELIVQTGRVMQSGSASAEIATLQRHWRSSADRLRWFVPNQTLTELNEKIMQLDALAGTDTLAAELAGVSADLAWIRDQQLRVF